MLSAEKIQIKLKENKISQRQLVQLSGLPESVVSTIINNTPILLPFLVRVLGENPFIYETDDHVESAITALESLALSEEKSNLRDKDPSEWQRETRKDRELIR